MTLSLEQELDLYKKALVDWEKPIRESLQNETYSGFCLYFSFRGLDYSFPERLSKFTTKEEGSTLEDYLFEGAGNTKRGRSERIAALRSCIAEIKNELKQEG